jgi:hypothetical protein
LVGLLFEGLKGEGLEGHRGLRRSPASSIIWADGWLNVN